MFPSLAINYSLGHNGHKSAMSGVFLWLCRAMSGVFLCILVFKCHLIPTKDKHNPCKAIYVCQCCDNISIWKKGEKSYHSDDVIYIAIRCFLCVLVFKCHLIPTKDKHNPCKVIYVC